MVIVQSFIVHENYEAGAISFFFSQFLYTLTLKTELISLRLFNLYGIHLYY